MENISLYRSIISLFRHPSRFFLSVCPLSPFLSVSYRLSCSLTHPFCSVDWQYGAHRLYKKLELDPSVSDNLSLELTAAANNIIKKAIMRAHTCRISRHNPMKFLEKLMLCFGMVDDVGSSL